jgi:hypothetical protein
MPGGYIELVELHVIPSSPDGTLPEPSAIMSFYTTLADIGKQIDLDLDIAQKFKPLLIDAGFEDVTENVFDVPLGDWNPDRRLKEIGAFQRFQMLEGLQGIGTGLLSRVAKWDQARLDAFFAVVRKEMRDPNVHSMYKL